MIRILIFFIAWILVSISAAGQPTLHPHITQLHIHGWSNHNGAKRPGSIGFHNWQSGHAGIDVLWWTEHHNLFNQDTLTLTF
jgi:hypothetical protein